MRLIGLGLLLLHVGCAAHSRGAPAPPTSQHEAAQATSLDGGIVVRPDASGIRVSYHSRRPEQAFRFNEDGAEIRKDTWKVLGAGLSLTGEGVAAMTRVSSFDITIAPDSRQRDRVYPTLSRVGEGWLIYAPHLRVEGASIPPRLSIEVPSGWSVVGRRDPKGELVGDGYVFAGPSPYVHRGAADIISAPSTPAWLVRAIEDSASGTVGFYEHRLGAALRAHPTIVVAHEPAQNGSYHGDTTHGAMMSLRFYGSEWNERDSAATEVVADFLNHELFHFWNGELAKSSEGGTRPWLHEGGANYAALLVSRERGTMSNERFLANLNRHLKRCQAALANLDLRTHEPKGGGGTYACGTILQWAIDIGLRKGSNGQRDVLSWWKDVLAKAQVDGGTYSLESAYAFVEPEAAKAADVLLGAGDARRWTTFAEAARGYGADMVQSRQPGQDLTDALDHVLVLHCGRDRGFSTFPDHVKLDTGTHCGPLNGNPEVDSVAGFNPVAQSSAMNDKVRQLCASRQMIEFAWKGKIVARAPCATPLPAVTLGWQIRQDGAGLSSRHESP